MGRLPGTDAAAFEQHLFACAECRAAMEDAEQYVQAMRGAARRGPNRDRSDRTEAWRLNMDVRLSRWGVGPRIAVSAIIYATLAALATHHWPEACLVPALAHPVFRAVAAVLLVVGLPMWVAGGIAAMRAYNQDELVTTGVFGVVRHPIYASWIVFNFPGLALLTRSWPLLLTPLVGYGVFKALIRREDDYLLKRFGKAYLEYRGRVNEVLPTLWRR
jgi:protein-S-isoprenylcysteine O-methyltransferase Ste14